MLRIPSILRSGRLQERTGPSGCWNIIIRPNIRAQGTYLAGHELIAGSSSASQGCVSVTFTINPGRQIVYPNKLAGHSIKDGGELLHGVE